MPHHYTNIFFKKNDDASIHFFELSPGARQAVETIKFAQTIIKKMIELLNREDLSENYHQKLTSKITAARETIDTELTKIDRLRNESPQNNVYFRAYSKLL